MSINNDPGYQLEGQRDLFIHIGTPSNLDLGFVESWSGLSLKAWIAPPQKKKKHEAVYFFIFLISIDQNYGKISISKIFFTLKSTFIVRLSCERVGSGSESVFFLLLMGRIIRSISSLVAAEI